MAIRKEEVKSIWETQLTDVFSDHTKQDMDILLSIISLVLYDRFDDNLGKLYTVVNDVDLFTSIINEFSGMTIQIPERIEFKNAISIALAYHYKEIKKMKWEDIKKELPFGEDIPLRTGKGISKLNKSIKEQLNTLMEGKDGQ